MANGIYNKGREAFMSGGINMSSDTIKVALVDSADYTVNLSTHQYFSSVAGAGVVATGTLASKTVTDGIFDAAVTLRKLLLFIKIPDQMQRLH